MTQLTTEEKSLAITQAIRHLVHNEGKTVREAYDSIFGKGSYDELLTFTYNSLKQV